MIYGHEALLTVCRLDNCANVKAVYHQSPQSIPRSVYRASLWMGNTAQWVQGRGGGQAGWEVTRTSARKEL